MEKEPCPYKVLSSEYLHHAPWLTVRCEHLLLPNGNHIPTYYVLEYPDWVNTLAITRDGQFVFVRQYRHALGMTSYELCAGVRDASDPSPLAAAQRELWEETGYGGGEWKEYMQISANPTSHTNITYCFLATGVERLDDQHLEPTEQITVHLLSLDQVKDLLRRDQIKQALMAAPLWKYMAENGLFSSNS